MKRKTVLKEAKEKLDGIRKLLAKGNGYSKPLLTQLDLIEYAAAGQWDKFTTRIDAVSNDNDFSSKNYFIIGAANDVVSTAPAVQYPNALKWASQIEKSNPDLFTRIQLADLKKRIFKKQGKTAEAEVMASKAQDLRKEAMQKGQMTPPMMKD